MNIPGTSGPLRGLATASHPTQLFGDPVAVDVLGAFPDAVYLGGGHARDWFVLAVLGPRAAAIPGAVVIFDPGRACLVDLLRGGDRPGRIGGGSITIGGLWVTVRTGARAGQRKTAERTAPAGILLSALEHVGHRGVSALGCDETTREVAARGHRLQAAACGGDRNAVAAAALALLGFGPGLTPAGDDVLAGHMAAARALGGSAAQRHTCQMAALIDQAAPDRTTWLSTALLRHAAAGRTAGPLSDLLLALAAGRSVDRPLTHLLAIGHTSGAATAIGVATVAPITANVERKVTTR